MSIKRFFTETLGATLRNYRWSWGAYDDSTNRVFLRIWSHEFTTIHGQEAVQVLNHRTKSGSPGHNERSRHIELIERGAHGYGVLCHAADPNTEGPHTIENFETSFVIEITQIVRHQDSIYALTGRRISAQELAQPHTDASIIAEDITGLQNAENLTTDQNELIQARLGQGRFRKQVLQQWNHQCAVTGISTPQVIRASHIKPWRSATNKERLDPQNGLPLIATLDALFDSGLISFEDNGKLLFSSNLPEDLVKLFLIRERHLRAAPKPQMCNYLSYHRNNIFLG